ncbi:MAG: aspartate dehydrogenase [Gammaproteobacteria bacterium]
MKKLAMIGFGSIGRYVAGEIAVEERLQLTSLVVRPERIGTRMAGLKKETKRVSSIVDLEDRPDLFIDCAGHEGLRQHGAAVLALGIDLVTVSVGALADEELYTQLMEAAQTSGAQLHLVSGAIGALDALSAARVGGLEKVVYKGRKPPLSWAGSAAEQVLDLEALTDENTHFSGTAREAALRYPKNANVAAAVALAGCGLDATRVELIADPHVSSNIHEIAAEGAFGRFYFKIEGNALPNNPKSSALTAMSVVRSVLNLEQSIVI